MKKAALCGDKTIVFGITNGVTLELP